MNDIPIKLSDVKKYYRSGVRGLGVQALDSLSLEVGRGEVFGLLGPNGAGKSTAIKIMLGIIRPNSGSCLLFGQKISRDARRRIGYLPEAPNFYKFLSARELVIFYASLCGMSKASAAEAAVKAINLVGLQDAADRRLSEYSKGMLQRAGLAQAIAHDPELVILDEPSSGLDPVGMADMASMIMRLKEDGKTVLLCSHLLNEVESLCDRVAIISKGRLAASGNLDELLRRDGVVDISVENMGDPARMAIEAAAAENGARIISEEPARISLSDYFKSVVGKDGK